MFTVISFVFTSANELNFTFTDAVCFAKRTNCRLLPGFTEIYFPDITCQVHHEISALIASYNMNVESYLKDSEVLLKMIIYLEWSTLVVFYQDRSRE